MKKSLGIFYKIVGWPLYWFLTLSGTDRLIKLDEKADAELESEFKSDAADLYSVFGPAQCQVCKEVSTGLIFISFADKEINPRCVACAKKAVNSLVEHVGWKAPYPTQSAISRSC